MFRCIERREIAAIRRYPNMEKFADHIEKALKEERISSSSGPPEMLTTPWLFALATAIGRHAEHSALGQFAIADLWFLGFRYLEAREISAFWRELSNDEQEFVIWFFENDRGYDDGTVLTVRERIVVALSRRDMLVPRHFSPQLYAVT